MSTDFMSEPPNLILDAIEAAEAIPDPLAGLVELTATDPGAPFMPEALEALSALKQVNRAAFEALRSQLKKAGCRVTALDDAIAEENGDAGGRRHLLPAAAHGIDQQAQTQQHEAAGYKGRNEIGANAGIATFGRQLRSDRSRACAEHQRAQRQCELGA